MSNKPVPPEVNTTCTPGAVEPFLFHYGNRQPLSKLGQDIFQGRLPIGESIDPSTGDITLHYNTPNDEIWYIEELIRE